MAKSSIAAYSSFKPLAAPPTVDATARLTVSRELSAKASFALSLDLRNAERQTYLLDLYGFDSSARDLQPAALAQIQQVLAPLGIEWMPGKGDPESDIGPFTRRGVAWAWLGHDGSEYFDLHHTADDTLDKIDPEALAQNVAAYAVFAWLAAQADGGFGSAPRAPEPAAR